MIQAEAHRLGKSPSVDEQLKLHRKRQRLQAQLDTFASHRQTLFGADIEGGAQIIQPPMIEEWEPEDSNSDDNNNDGNHPIIDLDSSAILPEFQILSLPFSQQITPNSSQAL